MYGDDDQNELTEDEPALFAALPRERDPGPVLQFRVVSERRAPATCGRFLAEGFGVRGLSGQ
jgi:hypothetical protein